MKIKGIKVANGLFLALLFFSCVPYIFPAITYLIQRRPVYWVFDSVSSTSLIARYFPYLKDVMCVVLFVILLGIKCPVNTKLNYFFVIVFLYGTVLLLISSAIKHFSTIEVFQHVIAGVREYLYLWTVAMYFNLIEHKQEIKPKLIRNIIHMHYIVFLIQFSIVLLNVLIFGNFNIMGTGGIRIIGAFGNSGSLGYYTIGAIFFTTVMSLYGAMTNKIAIIIQYIGSIFLSLASGMRLAQIIVFIMTVVSIIFNFYTVMRLKKKYLLLITTGFLAVFVPYFLQIIIERTERGALSLSAAGRFDTIHYLFNQNLYFLLFGSGIGIGTNTLVLFNTSDARIFDGTLSTIIGQFGLVGLLCFVYICYKLFKINIYKMGEFKALIYMIALSLFTVFISGNFFEQYALVLWTVSSLYLAKNFSKN